MNKRKSVKIHCEWNDLKGNVIFLSQNDKSHITCKNFASYLLSTANTTLTVSIFLDHPVATKTVFIDVMHGCFTVYQCHWSRDLLRYRKYCETCNCKIFSLVNILQSHITSSCCSWDIRGDNKVSALPFPFLDIIGKLKLISFKEEQGPYASHVGAVVLAHVARSSWSDAALTLCPLSTVFFQEHGTRSKIIRFSKFLHRVITNALTFVPKAWKNMNF